MFETITAAPPDAILGLTEAFNADSRPDKLNLAVGVYRDGAGKTPTLKAVAEAERRLLAADEPKTYLPITGPPQLGVLSRELLFGDPSQPTHALVHEGRAISAQTPGGTGGLRVAADFIAQQMPKAKVWLSGPTWPNHPSIFGAAGVATATYRYYDAARFGLDAVGMLEDLNQVAAGDVVLLHGCCHNPSGVDLDAVTWQKTAHCLAERGALPLVDLAYQGFAEGVDADVAGLRTLLSACPESIITQSFSKTFGLYNERIGCMTLVAGNADAASAALSQLKIAIRTNYSNPPAHGGRLVQTVLADPALRQEWLTELDAMRARINGVRSAFGAALTAAGVALGPTDSQDGGNAFISRQRGMFSFSGLSPDQVKALREDHAIYIVGSGRINVAGITDAAMPRLVTAIAAVQS